MRQFRPLDLLSLRAVVDAAIAPAGDEFTYAVREPSGATALWRGFDQSGEPAPLTRGPRDTNPRYSPDGRHIAFLRGDGAAAQIYLLDRRGGEAMPFTRLSFGVREFSWSLDGRSIAAIVPAGPSGPRPLAAGDSSEPSPADATDALILLQMDGTWRQLSVDGLACSRPAFAPNGGRVAFLAHEPAGRNCLAIVSVDGGDAQLLVGPEYEPGPAAFSPDATHVIFAARPPGQGAPSLYTVRAEGGVPEPYAEGPGDAPPPAAGHAPVYSIDGSSVYALLGTPGRYELAEVRPRLARRPRSPQGLPVSRFAIDDEGSRTALVVAEQLGPARFELRDTAGHLLLRSRHEEPGLADVQRFAPYPLALEGGAFAHLYLPETAESAPFVLLASRCGHGFSAQAQTMASGGLAVIAAPPGLLGAARAAALGAFPQLDGRRFGVCAEGDDALLDWPLLPEARAAAFTNPPEELPTQLAGAAPGGARPAVLLLLGADVGRQRAARVADGNLVAQHVFSESGPVHAWPPMVQTTRLALEAEWFSRHLAL